jgi:hypothetical protein
MKTAAKAKLVGGTMILLGAMFITGCSGGPASPDEATDRTATGIRVVGAGPELHAAIDQRWAEVEDCWGVMVSGGKQTVTIQQPERYDKAGLGVIRVNGELVYGMRIGDKIWVAPDLAALRHEFSHVVGERATGHLVENGEGKCWL